MVRDNEEEAEVMYKYIREVQTQITEQLSFGQRNRL